MKAGRWRLPSGRPIFHPAPIRPAGRGLFPALKRRVAPPRQGRRWRRLWSRLRV